MKLQKLQEYKSSLWISEIRDINSTDDSWYLKAAYAQKILLLNKKIFEAILQR